jgi:hypothetical protein
MSDGNNRMLYIGCAAHGAHLLVKDLMCGRGIGTGAAPAKSRWPAYEIVETSTAIVTAMRLGAARAIFERARCKADPVQLEGDVAPHRPRRLVLACETRWSSQWRCLRHLRENQRVLQHLAIKDRDQGCRLFGKMTLVDTVLSTVFWEGLQRWDALLFPVHEATMALQSDVITADRWHDCVSRLEEKMRAVRDLPAGLTAAVVEECVGLRIEFMSNPAYLVAKMLSPSTPSVDIGRHRKTVMTFLDSYLPPLAKTRFPARQPELVERDHNINQAHSDLLCAICDWNENKARLVESHGLRDPSVTTPVNFWQSMVSASSDGRLSLLRPLALQLLTCVINSAGVERHFKALKSIHSVVRNRLSATKTEQLTFIKTSLGTSTALAASFQEAKMARVQRLSMKPSRKRSREGDAEQHDGDGDDALDERVEGELYPPLQFFANAVDRRRLEELELAEVDADHYDDVGNDAVLDAGLD